MNYLTQEQIKKICSENSMCRDTFNAFKEKYSYLVHRITDLFSRGFNYPRGIIKYEINYTIYEFVLED